MVLDSDGGIIAIIDILEYKKAATQNSEVAQKLKEYLNLEISEPGCHMMCSAIDTFINKEFTRGLTLADKEYLAEYKIFHELLDSLSNTSFLYYLKLIFIMFYRKILSKIKKQTGEKVGYSDDELKELQKYLDTDKRYPYEGIGIGIEVEQLENAKREQLGRLVQTAKATLANLEDAQKLKERYNQSTSQEIRNG